MMVAGLSTPIWVLLAPFFGVSGSGLTELAVALGVVGEVTFWSGVVLAGRRGWRIIRGYGWRAAPGILLRVMIYGERAMPRDRLTNPVPNFVSIAPPPVRVFESQARFLSVPPPQSTTAQRALVS